LANKTNEVTPIAFDTNLTISKDVSGRAVINFPNLVNNNDYEYFWYQKTGNDVIITDQYTRTPSLVNPNTGGTYKLRLLLKKPNGNTNYRDVVITISNTITDIKDEHIDLGKSFENWSIYTIAGQKIKEGIQSKIITADLDKGIYIINNEEGQYKISIP